MTIGMDTKSRLDATINMVRMCILEKGESSIPRLLSTFNSAFQVGSVLMPRPESHDDRVIIEIANIANQGTRNAQELKVVYAATVVILADLRLAKCLREVEPQVT